MSRELRALRSDSCSNHHFGLGSGTARPGYVLVLGECGKDGGVDSRLASAASLGPFGAAAAGGVVLDSAASEALSELALRKVSRRLLPLFMLMVALNYIDRTSLSFASLGMLQDVGLSPEVFGFGGGLFFLTYCLMQVPSNVLCMRVGVSRWLSAIMVAWGLVAAGFAFVTSSWQFYCLRLALGLAEAGSFPGVWFAISQWWPPNRTSGPFAMLAVAIAASQVLAAPLAAGLLRLDSLLGLAGWQWVFLGEALPAVALGLALPWLLPDGPDSGCAFLTSLELAALQDDWHARVASMQLKTAHSTSGGGGGGGAHKPSSSGGGSLRPAAAAAAAAPDPEAATASSGSSSPGGPESTWQLLRRVAGMWQIHWLAGIEILKIIGLVGLQLWLPLLVQALITGDMSKLQAVSSASGGEGHGSTDTSTLAVLLTGVPFSLAALATVWSGRRAQRPGSDPLSFVVAANLVAGACFVGFHAIVSVSRWGGFAALCVVMCCGFSSSPMLPSIIARLTAGPAAAIAMPAYNSCAMLGGFVGPALFGWVVQRAPGGVTTGVLVLGCSMLGSAAAAAGLRHVLLRSSRGRAVLLGGHGPDGADAYTTVYSSSSFARHSSHGAASRAARASSGGAATAAAGAAPGEELDAVALEVSGSFVRRARERDTELVRLLHKQAG